MLRVTLLYDLFCGLKIVGVDLNLAANRFNPQPRDRDLFVKNNRGMEPLLYLQQCSLR